MQIEVTAFAVQKGAFVNVTLCSDPLVALHLSAWEAKQWAKQLAAAARHAEAKHADIPKMRTAKKR